MNTVAPTRRRVLQATAGATLFGVAGCVSAQQGADDYDTIQVPGAQPSIQAGVDAATPGDLVLVAEGTYEEAVDVEKAGITIRGTDRNEVVLDGGFDRRYGLDVEADGVAVENLTAKRYDGTGVYWDDVEGFRGSYLTTHTNRAYGVYAIGSRDGRFEYCYASGHGDAGFYLGRNHPFEAVIANVVAERNALGYSGTSAGGDLTIRDSVWIDNGAGIVPHTLDRADPPQRENLIANNVVLDNDNPEVPFRGHTYPPFGTGILVWGGNENVIERNLVSGHEHVGIAVQSHAVESSDNVVRGNLVRNSEVADLGLGVPAGDGNRFVHNGFSTSLPADVEGEATGGSERVAEIYEDQERRAEEGDVPDVDWREGTPPGPQPTMPDTGAPPLPASKESSWGPMGDETRDQVRDDSE